MIAAEFFLRAEWWPILLAAPLLIGAAVRIEGRRRADLQRFVTDDRRAPLCADLSPGLRRARHALLAAAIACASLALLDPVAGEEIRPSEERGVDVMVCLDVSRSMLARDLPPSRLVRARREIEALADRARGDRLGLVAFAGEAKLAIPLTHDADTFRGLVESVDPLTVRRGGTDLARAIDAAVAALDEAAGEGKDVGPYSVILLLTDGEDLEGHGLEAAKRAAARGITIHCVGFGSTRGSKIAVEEEGGRGATSGEAFLKDEKGEEVVSSMDPDGLRKIATAAGGEFLRADAVALPLLELYEKRIVPQSKRSYAATERRDFKHRFQWPLFAAIPLWLLHLGLTDRRRSRRAAAPR